MVGLFVRLVFVVGKGSVVLVLVVVVCCQRKGRGVQGTCLCEALVRGLLAGACKCPAVEGGRAGVASGCGAETEHVSGVCSHGRRRAMRARMRRWKRVCLLRRG